MWAENIPTYLATIRDSELLSSSTDISKPFLNYNINENSWKTSQSISLLR
jgi:hypothetical protein